MDAKSLLHACRRYNGDDTPPGLNAARMDFLQALLTEVIVSPSDLFGKQLKVDVTPIVNALWENAVGTIYTANNSGRLNYPNFACFFYDIQPSDHPAVSYCDLRTMGQGELKTATAPASGSRRLQEYSPTFFEYSKKWKNKEALELFPVDLLSVRRATVFGGSSVLGLDIKFTVVEPGLPRLNFDAAQFTDDDRENGIRGLAEGIIKAAPKVWRHAWRAFCDVTGTHTNERLTREVLKRIPQYYLEDIESFQSGLLSVGSGWSRDQLDAALIAYLMPHFYDDIQKVFDMSVKMEYVDY